ncbi:hypothetical protein BJV78DRAFT_1226451 [Lactifluus subvellereus]|nr:hypothetical protein BJV78DRAFT_1226451 [Lactifluus subvellereus]
MSVTSTTSVFNTGVDHIIMDSEPEVWSDLKARNWVPLEAKDHPRHEPRDGLLVCHNDHDSFDRYRFFIRYFPELSPITPLIAMRHSILYSSHEMRIRGFHHFKSVQPPMPNANEVAWQDWISSDGVFDSAPGSFKRTGSSDISS